MIKRAIFLLLTVFTFTAQASNTCNLGLPFVKHFKSSDYGASHQNWATAQAQNGFMYFGNTDGLLEFNGQEWKIYKMPNRSMVRCIHISTDNKIYVGALNEFGFFERDKYGSLIYTSLSSEIKETDIQTVWKIVEHNKAIYFIAEMRRIFKYDFKKVSKISIPPVLTKFHAFSVNNIFYIFDHKAGLAILKNDTVYRYQNETFDEEIGVYSILPIENDYILLGSSNKGLIKVNTKKLSPLSNEQTNVNKTKTVAVKGKTSIDGILFYEEFNSDIKENIKKSGIYYGMKNSNDELVYATLRGGIFVLDQKGNLIDRYTTNNGIPDNSVLFVYEDMEYNLWATTEKGISVLEPFGGYRIFETNSAFKGNILSLSSINKNIYIGTTTGLYSIENEQSANILLSGKYNTITNDYIYILSFLKNASNNQSFLFSSLDAIHEYNIKTKKLKYIHGVYGGFALASYPLDSSVVFIGHSPGFTAIKREKNDKYSVIETFDGSNDHIRSVIFDKKGTLYISTEFSGLLILKFNKPDCFKDYSLVRYGVINGLPNDESNCWSIIGDSIIALTTNGVYLPDKQENIGKQDLIFQEYSELNKQFNKENSHVKQIIELKNGDWLIKCKYEVTYFAKEQKKLIRQPFLRISDSEIGTMCVDDNERVWISSLDYLYCYDHKTVRKASDKQTIFFTNITIGHDSTIPIRNYRYNNNVMNIGDISFKYNSLKINVAYPSYKNLENIKYSFYLDGIDKSWTPWTNVGKYKISYLPVGQHTLHVKALDSDGNETNEIKLIFKIKPPFYRTTIAFIFYIVVISAIIYSITRLYTLKLKRDGQKLKETIKKAVSTVEKQKDELIEQSKQLETINLELDKLSLVARYTDNAVIITDAKGNFEWINEGFTQFYGYKLEELNETTRKKIGRISPSKINNLLNAWSDDKAPITYETLNMHKNGSKIWIQTTLTPILNENNQIIKLVAIDTNISKLKEAEEEVKLKTDEVQIQRDIAILQRDEILRQKNEITSSILYAERIQKALLHTETQLNRLYKDNFVLSIPRNIVSGDFFWCHSADNYKIIAVADCTGHGVPGAFMSLIGISFLKEIVSTLGFYKPEEILNLLRYNIIYSLNQKCDSGSVDGSKDGMDISLVTIDIQNNTLYYAGANFPIYIINNSKLTEYKPDRMPIGIHRNNHLPFTLHTIPIRKDDRVYMFTDGYIDQFGGKDRKKLKRNRFKEKIVELQEFSFDEQRNRLKNFFKVWSAGIEQVDDVLIVGFDTNSET